MWIAFTKDNYATAKSALVTKVAADERAGGERTADQGRRPLTTGGRPDNSVSPDTLGYVPYDQRLYDTLMLLFRAGGAPTGQGRPVVRPRVIVHAPVELLLNCSGTGTSVGAEVAEIEGVGPVPAEVARRSACDAHVVLSVESPDGSILHQGRARRDPTVAQRIEIARRDKGCRFPGCTFTDFTDVHHVQHWGHGGATDLDNLVTLCGRHHRAVHELGWVVEGNANVVLSFTSPHGRVMRSVPSPTWPRTSPVLLLEDGPRRR